MTSQGSDSVFVVWDTCGISHYCRRVIPVNDKIAKIALHSGSTLETPFGIFSRLSPLRSAAFHLLLVSKISLKNLLFVFV